MAIAVPPDLEPATAEEVLAYAAERFHPRLFVACSFQKEASVIMDMLLRIEPEARFFTLDTGVLFEETYETWRAVERHYDVRVEVFKGISLDEQARRHGDELWERDPDACCGIRKVQPLKRALADARAWMTGLRRDQSITRTDTPAIEWDEGNGIMKVNPIIEWSNDEVWAYIRTNKIPYNKLHDKGFPSIGCAPCTRAIKPGEDIRAGRWWWENPEFKECGLHE